MAKNEIFALRARVVRIARTHFLLASVIIAQIMIYDAWKLIDPVTVLQRWLVVGLMLAIVSVVWYLARGKSGDLGLYKRLVFTLVAVDIFLASFMVYIQRGMASRAVFLYAIPIIVSSALFTRSALFTASVLSIVAYTVTTVSYFVFNFNEGYKIELYGEVGFYCIIMLIFAELIWSVVRSKKRG